MGEGWANFLHLEDRPRVIKEWQDATLHRRNQVAEFRFVNHKTGERCVIASAVALFDSTGVVSGYVGTIVDVTVLEEEQQHLRHAIEFQDQERELIASEIHDGLVQYATGALMQLEAVQPHVAANELAERIDSIIGILRRTVAEGRRLMNGIRPPVLDDWGVVAAVEQLIDEEDRGACARSIH